MLSKSRNVSVLPSPSNTQESTAQANTMIDFDSQFSACKRLLRFIAVKVLGNDDEAEEVIRNCYASASQVAHEFTDIGEFRRWLLRVAIDEALLLQHQRRKAIAFRLTA